jgi:hypothetical protein
MSATTDSIPFELRQLATLDEQIARVLAWAKRPGMSDEELRNLCRALFHLLRCRQMALAWCDAQDVDDA